MRVLVTGAGGFVGLHLAAHLLKRGDDVLGTVFEEQHGVLPSRARAETVDVSDLGRLCALFDQYRPEAIIHLAGLSDVAASWTEMARYFQVNVLGTENVLRAAPHGCTVVFASSAEVYGKVQPDDLPLTEEHPLAPASPYALSKAAAERLALEAGAIVVRSFNLVGPGQSPRFALPSFAAQLASIKRGEREPVLRVGNLDARRDFLHVEDGVSCYGQVLLAAAQGVGDAGAGGERGRVFNLASGRATSIRTALDMLIEASGVKVRVELDPERMRPSDVPEMCGDASRLRALGWHPRRGLQDVVNELWRSVDAPRGV